MGARLLLVTVCSAALLWPQDAGDPQRALGQAMEWISAGRIAEARQLLESLEKSQPANGEVLYRLGVLDLRDGDHAAAGRRLERAAELMPASPLPWLAVARVRLETGRKTEAIEAAEKANQLAPEHPAVGRALAMFYAQAEEFARAAEFELRWLASNPKDDSSRLRVMDLLVRAGDAAKAIELGSRSTRLTAEIHAGLGRAHRAAGDAAAAVESFQAAIRESPENPANYVALAALFLDHRTPDPALAILDQASAKFPANLEILRLRGLALYGLGRNGEALDDFIRMAKLDPDSEIALASMETLLPDAGERLPEIVELLRSYCDRHPSAVALHLLAAAVSLDSPGSKEPAELLRKSIAIRGDYWPAYYALHEILFDQGKWTDAAAALEKTVELNPEHGAAHFRLAQVYARMGDRERAAGERRKHHEIAERIRVTEEERRENLPRLSYEIADPGQESARP